jgi:hypothetical protein
LMQRGGLIVDRGRHGGRRSDGLASGLQATSSVCAKNLWTNMFLSHVKYTLNLIAKKDFHKKKFFQKFFPSRKNS